VEGKNAFFKSSPVDEYHLPQMNSGKVFFLGVGLIEHNLCGTEGMVRYLSANLNPIFQIFQLDSNYFPTFSLSLGIFNLTFSKVKYPYQAFNI
jgi:hypothetical protein